MLIGYARTSTVEQVAGLEAQAVALAATGCDKLFSEQASSVAQRDQLAAALDPSTSSGEPLCARATRWS
jgi:DNA invertase Pin-like site-specific DNA recombinase